MGAGIGGGTLLGVLSAYTIIELARVEKHCVLDAPLLKRMTYPQVSFTHMIAQTTCTIAYVKSNIVTLIKT